MRAAVTVSPYGLRKLRERIQEIRDQLEVAAIKFHPKDGELRDHIFTLFDLTVDIEDAERAERKRRAGK